MHLLFILEVQIKPVTPHTVTSQKTNYLTQAYLKSTGNVDEYMCDNALVDPSCTVLDIGGEGVLGPGNTVLLPMWIRGDKIGAHQIKLLFGYQTLDVGTSWKSLKFGFGLNVQPSLRINAFTRPSGRDINTFILGLEVSNMNTCELIIIKRLRIRKR